MAARYRKESRYSRLSAWLTRRRRKPTWLPAPDATAREAARSVVLARVARWSAAMAVRPKKVFIRNQRSRWGSASSLGNVSFNWRIAGLPEAVQDYIVIHELAHLVEMNHAPPFWAIVARHCPDYRAHRRWLREQQIATL